MRRHHRTTRLLAPALALGLVAGASACSSGGDGDVAAPELQLIAGLQPVDDCEALLGRLQEAALERVGPYGFGGGPYYFDAFSGDDGASSFDAVGSELAGAPRPAATTATTVPSDVSGTNVQEAGVDEPDIVKADGERILAVADGKLHWIDVTGDEPVDAGSVDLPEGYGQQLLVDGDKALVLVTGEFGPMPIEGDVFAPSFVPPESPFTSTIAQVDVSAPDAMVVTNTLEVEGSVLNARLVDGTARVVVTSLPENLNFVYPSNESEEAAAIAEAANRSVIEGSKIEDWVPSYRHLADPAGADEAVVDEGPLVECDRMRTPIEFSGFGTLSVLTIDVDAELGVGDAVGVLADGEHVYASADHLYVATTNYPEPEESDQETEESPTTTDQAPSTTEDAPTTTEESPATTDGAPSTTIDGTSDTTAEDTPSTTVGDDTSDTVEESVLAPTPNTAIHRFSIEGDGPADYERSGEVRGRLLDQFSMSELPGETDEDDLLRVATTDDQTSESYVSVLRDGGGELLEIGQVGGLGEGEEIYSVRFVGDMGYVVTFRQTDPLYTIDLSDPTQPTLAGELELLGYSAYLHPIDDDLLLGIGQDATAEGRTTGTQLSLFDVSDPATPTRLQNVSIPGSSSAAEYDHHAFLYWPETGLAVLPIQSFGGVVDCPPDVQCSAPNAPLNGAIGYHVDAGGIDEVGRITHDDGALLARSVVIGDTLYTLSETSLVASDLATLAPQAALDLT